MNRRAIGLIGLGPMGLGLARNLKSKGVEVYAWDQKITSSVDAKSFHAQSKIDVCCSLDELVDRLDSPRFIMLCIPSGAPIEEVNRYLRNLLAAGDVVADCGNSYFRDTELRIQEMALAGLGYLGIGISGGPDGAKAGPSIMVGGDRTAYDSFFPILDALAANVNGKSCCGYFGHGGAGHFVKMVHNGIEYALMHLLMEVYQLLRRQLGGDNGRIAAALRQVTGSLSGGYLSEVTIAIIEKRLPREEEFVLNVIDDTVGQKGTGLWSVITALEQETPIPTIAEAVMYRALTHRSRVEQEVFCPASVEESAQFLNFSTLSDALTLSFLSVFAQGLDLINSCQSSLRYSLDVSEVIRIWRGGCILKGSLVDFLWENLPDEAGGDNILYWNAARSLIKQTLPGLRVVASTSSLEGHSCPGLSSALSYVEAHVGRRLPTEILQAQRDYFGRHGLRHKHTGEPLVVTWVESKD